MSAWARLCPGSLFASENNRNNSQLERRHVNKLSGTEVKVILKDQFTKHYLMVT